MAVQDNGTRIQYTATASQTVFPYPFEILDEDDITVVQNSTTLSKTTHYTVSGVGSDTGGNITFVTGATSGDVITIYRSMALSRVTNYQANAAFLESEVDADFDRLWMAVQQNDSDATRGIRASQTDSILNSTNTELATPTTRAGKVLGFDSTGALSYYASTVASADFIQVTTTAAMAALASPTVGDVVQTAEFSTGNGGGGTYDCVTVGTTANVDLPNTYNIIVSTVDATKCFVLRRESDQDARAWGVVSDGVADDRPAINHMLAAVSGAGSIIFDGGQYYLSKDGANAWALSIPSDTSIIMRNSPRFILEPDAPDNSRIFNMQTVARINILGYFEIDGQSDTVVTDTTGEQSHGVFIARTTDVYIEDVYIFDCYGDAFYAGGVESVPSERIHVGKIRTFRSGRNSFTVNYVDNLKVEIAILDNTTGGRLTSWAGGITLDVEPDSFAGTREYHQRFDYVWAKGTDTQFTAGTSEANADMWFISIGTYHFIKIDTDTTDALTLYAVTLTIDQLEITGKLATNGMDILYGARLFADKIKITSDSTSEALLCQRSSSQSPKINIQYLEIVSPNGKGCKFSGAEVNIGKAKITSSGGKALDLLATDSKAVNVESLHTIDSGASSSYVVEVAPNGTTAQQVRIGHILCEDTRGSPASTIVRMNDLYCSDLFTIGTISNPNSISADIGFSGAGTLKYVRVSGSQNGLSPGQFICVGTPEAMIPAAKGSIALRRDGGAATSFYVKETGSANTGWVAK
jgi:hypothetical protein